MAVIVQLPAFSFLVVLMPRTLTKRSVGCPAARDVRPSVRASNNACLRTAPCRGVLLEGGHHKARVHPVAGQVAVQIREALAVGGNVAARGVSPVKNASQRSCLLIATRQLRQGGTILLHHVPKHSLKIRSNSVSRRVIKAKRSRAEQADCRTVDKQP